jgi:hypothetical protein
MVWGVNRRCCVARERARSLYRTVLGRLQGGVQAVGLDHAIATDRVLATAVADRALR